MDAHNVPPRIRMEKDEEILRPIIAAWVVDNQVSPEAFKLSSADKKDFNRLSIVRGAESTPRQAYEARLAIIKERCEANGREFKPPAGVYGLQVTDVETVAMTDENGSRTPLTVWDDSMNEGIPHDHGHIDFNDVPPSDKGAVTFVAKVLLQRAKNGGWKYRPSS